MNISIPTEELNDSTSSKQISWGNNTTIEPNETTQPNDSIFSKLKKTFTQAPTQPTMDIQALYEYVNKRFDQLEELIRQERRLGN